MRIAIVGDPEDLSLAYFAWMARQRGAEVIELAEDRLGADWSFDLRDGADGPHGTGATLYRGDDALPVERLDGAFVRLNPGPGRPAALADLPEPLASQYTVERRYGLHLFLEALPARVVNRPSAGRSNSSKPYQMRLLAAAGFRVPPWCATNRPADARAFLESCPEGAVYKACSGLRSQVRRADDELLGRLADSCPVLLQRYVPGSDVRIHTVGERAFATRIEAASGGDGIDYRFDDGDHRYTAVDAPPDLVALCLRVAGDEGLELAGFDFRVAPDDTWWCLEVNPVPTYLPYEAAAGHPIASSVLDLMAADRGLHLAPAPEPAFAQVRRSA